MSIAELWNKTTWSDRASVVNLMRELFARGEMQEIVEAVYNAALTSFTMDEINAMYQEAGGKL